MSLRPGVNIYGYVYAESGVGEHTRLLVDAVRKAGLDYAVVPYTKTLSRQEASFDDFGSSDPVYDVNIVSVNADEYPWFVERFGRQILDGRYTIGLWAWEVELFPDWMARSGPFLDEVWANSTFSATAIGGSVSCPVLPFPLPIKTPTPPARSRAELGLPEGFLFLFTFDFDSVFERKNPLGTIEAFRQAFAPGEGPRLVIKSINAERHPREHARLLAAAEEQPDVDLYDRYLPAEERHALMAACDAYVSLHRAEGFGLTMAEALALGKPVVATGYSGNLDFMNEDNSELVPYRLVPIPEDCGPYPTAARWAEPDVAAAAKLLRRIFEAPQAAREKAERAREEIARLHGPEARAGFVAERLASIRRELAGGPRPGARAELPRFRRGADVEGQGWWHTDELAEVRNAYRRRETGTASKPLVRAAGPDAGGLAERLQHVEDLLARGPDVDLPSRFGPLVRRLRRLVLRLQQNFALHQQTIGSELLASIRGVDERLRALENGETEPQLVVGRELRTLSRRVEEALARTQDPAGSHHEDDANVSS